MRFMQAILGHIGENAPPQRRYGRKRLRSTRMCAARVAAVARAVADEDPLEHREAVVVDHDHLCGVAAGLRRLVRHVQHGLAVAEHKQQYQTEHAEAHEQHGAVAPDSWLDRADAAGVGAAPAVAGSVVACGVIARGVAYGRLRHIGIGGVLGHRRSSSYRSYRSASVGGRQRFRPSHRGGISPILVRGISRRIRGERSARRRTAKWLGWL